MPDPLLGKIARMTRASRVIVGDPGRWAAVVSLALLLGGVFSTRPAKAAESDAVLCDGVVTDLVQALATGLRTDLERRLQGLQQAGVSTRVLIVDTTRDEAIESFARRVGNRWNASQQCRSDALVVVASKDRRIRLSVADHAAATLTDGKAKDLIDRRFTPAVRQGGIGAGLLDLVDGIAALTQTTRPVIAEPSRAPTPTREPGAEVAALKRCDEEWAADRLGSAASCYAKLDAQGSMKAKGKLGRLLLATAYGERARLAEGWSLVEAAARAGDARSQATWGNRFVHGDGVAKDHDAALRWLRMSADSGDYAGMAFLAVMYTNGWGVRADQKQGTALFKRAADLGFVYAQSSLGIAYNNGSGVSKDERAAYFWFQVAARQGDTVSYRELRVLEEFAPGLSEQDMSKAKAEAEAWLAAPADRPARPSPIAVRTDLARTAPEREAIDREIEGLKPRMVWARHPARITDPNERLIARIEAKGGVCGTVANHLRLQLPRSRSSGDWSRFQEILGRGTEAGC